jgi:hypothetical protein
MLADPLVVTGDWTTITPDATENISMPALERAADHSLYGYDDPTSANYEKWRIFTGHQYGKRSRYTVRITNSGIIPDFLIDGNQTTFQQSCYVVFDAPNTGAIDLSTSGLARPQKMLHMLGSFLVSVDTADPLFLRILRGET